MIKEGRRRWQLSLAEGLVARRAGQHERLERLARQLDWMRLGEIYAAREGRPAYPPLLMFKALLLQQWYTWSDPELEAALADRLSFRRLVGLALDQHAPDHATLSRFRAQLAPRALGARLFAAVNAPLTQRGLVRKGGASHFGYKAQVAMDLGSGLIRRALLTGARVNDSTMGDQLICGDEGAVLAGKA